MRHVQTMLLWYAYRLDIIAFGVDDIFLGRNCFGSAPDRSCYFDEFLRYIQLTGKETDAWAGRTNVGTNLNPDVLTTAKELATTRYSNTISPHQVFPNKWPRGYFPKFPELFGDVANNIQASRTHLNDQGIDDELEGVRRAIVSIHEARRADRGAGVIRDLNEVLSEHGYTWVRVLRVQQALYIFFHAIFLSWDWSVTNPMYGQTVETKTQVAPDLSTWTEIDTEATINAHPDESDALRNYIGSYVDNYDKISGTNQRHFDAIQSCQTIESRLLGDSSC